MVAEAPPPAITRPAPTRAARREFAQMTPEQRRARAEGVYRSTWEKAARLYGSTSPAPAFSFGRLGEGDTAGEVGEDGKLTLSPKMIRWLAKRPVKGPEGRYLGHRPEAQQVLLHEWAHLFQDPELSADPNQNHREEAAQLFATYYGHKMFGAPPMQRGGPIPYANRKQGSRDLAATYGKGYWRRRQFSSY